MEQKFSVALSGLILNNNRDETISNLSMIFLDKQPAEIESLINSKATIKKSIDLSLANKIKSRIERAGAECVISAEESIQSPPATEPALQNSEEKTNRTLESHKTEGALFISAAIILFLTLFLISDGYEPRLGLIWSINENMTVYNGHPFGCKDPIYASSSSIYLPGPKISGGCDESFKITLKTKYFLLVTLVVLAFGVGRYLNHFRSTKSYWRDISLKMGWG
ncbi:hypothetical protein EQ826_22515 [Ectopseudomonas mendocina]|nr:hypothetical protein [Pseudomonas mendocina]TRO21898.1 hypothetical protein EQ826_22515 [Pseudomonas mendocina]